MEYISAEEFLKQPKTIQAVFIEWWKCEIGDLFTFDGVDDRDMNVVQVIGSENQITITKANKGGSRIPLFVEGQLRKFIEDKTNKWLEVEKNIHNDYLIWLCEKVGSTTESTRKKSKSKNLLEAYWKVALEVASYNL